MKMLKILLYTSVISIITFIITIYNIKLKKGQNNEIILEIFNHNFSYYVEDENIDSEKYYSEYLKELQKDLEHIYKIAPNDSENTELEKKMLNDILTVIIDIENYVK